MAQREFCGHCKPAWRLHVVKQEKQERTVLNEVVHYGNTWCFCNTISFLLQQYWVHLSSPTAAVGQHWLLLV